MPYTQQIILAFYTGEGNEAINSHAEKYQQKAETNKAITPVVKFMAEGLNSVGESETAKRHLKIALDSLKKPSSEVRTRLYITGHGDYTKKTVGGRTADQVATIVNSLQFEFDVISITACSAGRDQGTTDQVTDTDGLKICNPESRLSQPFNSFASDFHKILKEKYNIKVIVYARVVDVAVDESDCSKYPSHMERISDTSNTNTGQAYPIDKMKICFKWDAETQKRDFIYTRHTKEPVNSNLDDDDSDDLPVFSKN